MSIRWHVDGGHAWLAVPTELLIKHGIADQVSSYSYVSPDGETVYLEEDCDAPRFFQASGLRDVHFPATYYPGHASLRRFPSWGAYWTNYCRNHLDGGEVVLTGPEHANLSDEELRAETLAEMDRAGLEMGEGRIVIGEWTE